MHLVVNESKEYNSNSKKLKLGIKSLLTNFNMTIQFVVIEISFNRDNSNLKKIYILRFSPVSKLLQVRIYINFFLKIKFLRVISDDYRKQS